MDAILVSGGAGYVGSHTCKALAKAGLRPVTLDNLVSGHADAVKWGPLIEADFGDVEAVRAAVREHKITAAMHFAAYSIAPESVHQPLRYYENNVGGTLRLLQALDAEGVGRVVFPPPSAGVYGATGADPVSEDAPLNPTHPYGETKRAIEGALRWIGEATGLTWCALRYFNAAGADEDAEIGERHEPETHLIPNIIQAVRARDGSPKPVRRRLIRHLDGSAVRDYVHVTKPGRRPCGNPAPFLEATGAQSKPLNLGSGEGLFGLADRGRRRAECLAAQSRFRDGPQGAPAIRPAWWPIRAAPSAC